MHTMPSHMAANSTIAAEKAALRARMLAARGALSEEERGSAAAVVEAALLGLPAVERATTVLAFASFGSEIPTDGIRSKLAAAGKRVLLPFLAEGRMEAAVAGPGDAMEQTSYGPVEPVSRDPVDPSTIDLVVVPGLAFDRAGRRVGYGRGYFDGYLPRVPRSAPRVAIGFALQVVDEVPAGPADELVDLVVTEAGVVECRPRRSA